MGPLDLFTDQELFEELRRRQNDKELSYLCYLGVSDADDGEGWLYMSDITYDQLQEIYEDEMDTFEGNHLYDSDNWNPTDKEITQWNEDEDE